jgi:hypothetical protein
VPSPIIWNSIDYPKGCRNCGNNKVLHHGNGLCQTCNKKPALREAAKTNTLEREFYAYDGTETSEGGAAITTADVEGHGVGSADTEGLTDNNRSRERRPGSVTSPVTETDPEPASGPSGLKEKLRAARDKAKAAAKGTTAPPQRTTRERKPLGATAKRASTAESLSDLWAGIGGLAERTGRHAPLGRYLAWQAPAAGEMLDSAVEGTPVDRLLQPIIRGRAKLDLVVAVVGPPGLILQIERSPHQFTLDDAGHLHHPLLPMLKSAIRSSLPTMLPAMKKAQLREKKVMNAIKEMFPDMPAGTDVVDEIITEMFRGYFAQVPPTAVYTDADGATVPA